MSLYRSLHDNYDALPARIRAIVDRAFNEATHEIRSAGLRTSNTDDAERLVDAIAAYIRRSNPERTVGWEFHATSERAVEENGGVSPKDREAFERARQGAKPPVPCKNCGGDGYCEMESGAVCSVCRGKGYVPAESVKPVCGHCGGEGFEGSLSGPPCAHCDGPVPEIVAAVAAIAARRGA